MKNFYKNCLPKSLRNLGVILAVIVLLGNIVTAQIIREGTLPSITYNIAEKAEVTNVYVPFSLEKLKAEDEKKGKNSGSPMRAGVSLPVGLGTTELGEWIKLPDGKMLWRATLKADGATALGVVFDRFNLPNDAELYLYNHDKSMVNGALGSQNNSEAQLLSTKILFGSSITIEYIETPSYRYQEGQYKPTGLLNIGELMYMYTDVYAIFDGSKPNTGGSDPCQIDINCTVGNSWQDQKRGVVHNVNRIGGSWYYCSGSMVNNTNEDFTPYYLTAFHCGEGASAADRNVWQFYFNYERPNCGSGAPPTTDLLTGCELRAWGPMAGGSDLLLVELNNPVPLSYNPFYNGWNRNDVGATSGAGIHHPSGDVKKISTFTSTLTSSTPTISGSIMASNSAWRVVWSANESGWGVTEGGSSGSPIFNQDGLIAGTLTGGSSFCTSQTAPDYYGKFSYHWESNGATNDRRLRPWLDPAGTNPTSLRGWDPQWSNNTVDAVADFQATPMGATEISLSWTKNANNDNVLVLWSNTNTFGTPGEGVEYTVGQTLAGGGTVLYKGSGSSYEHTGLDPATKYYYRAFSFDTSINYSAGRNASATTNCLPFNLLPFSENFNASTSIPICWEIVDHQGNGQVWQFGTHSNGLTGTTGNYAYLNSDAYGSGNSQNSDLVTPLLDLTGYTDITLSFTHYYRHVSSSATLSYSINNGASWTQIQQWTSSTSNPASFNQVIAAVGGQSEVRFRWNYTGTWGWYWDVDDVEITGTPVGVYANFTGDPLTVYVEETVTFTDASGGGTITSWDWDFGSGANPASATGQGPHEVTYSSIGQKTVTLTVNGDITKTKTNYITVTESPYRPPRQLAGDLQNRVDAHLNWLSPIIDDGFEDYTDFVLSFGGYTQVDVDGSATYGIENVTFPNAYYTGSFIVFNPSQTTPPLTGAWDPYEGQKYAACFAATAASNNDWLITPKLKLASGDHFSFYAKSITDQYGLERFRVAVSTTGTNPADFTDVLTAGSYVEAPLAWTKFSYDLSAFAGQEIYVAINCVSDDAFVFMVDKIIIEENPDKIQEQLVKMEADNLSSFSYKREKPYAVDSVQMAGKKNDKLFANYSVYRDGNLVGTTSGFSFVDQDLPAGTHTYALRANYIDPSNQSGNSNEVVLSVVPLELEWTGAASNNWHDLMNWNPEFVPKGFDDVTIPTSLANYPTLSAAGEADNIFLEDGVTLLDNGNLTIHGTATVQRHIPRNGWHFLSSPVSGMDIIDSDFVPNGNPLPSNFDFFAWNETAPLVNGNWYPWVNVRGAGGVPNVANFQQFVPGRGYLVAYTPTYSPENPFSFEGSLQTGIIGVTVNHSSTSPAIQGWNLIGNPYPSAINWASADKTLFTDNFAYIYDPTLGGGGAYHSEDGLIAPHQGFFVKKASPGTTTFNFTNTIRAHGGSWRNEEPAEDRLSLRLTRPDNNFYDETTLRVSEGSLFVRDRQDALKLFSLNPQMPQVFTQTADNVQVAINSIPEISSGLEVLLGVLAPVSGQYDLEMIETSGIFTNTTIWLHNSKDGSIKNLSASPTQALIIASGTHGPQFKLTFTQPTNTGSVEEDAVSIHTWENTLYINFTADANHRQLRMFDISGRQVLLKEMGQGTSYTIPLNLQPGVYVVQVASPAGVVNQRVFVR